MDHYKTEEILFLGPDEGTADVMDWASQRAKERGASFWKAFTTGKSRSLGGIPHVLLPFLLSLSFFRSFFFLSFFLLLSFFRHNHTHTHTGGGRQDMYGMTTRSIHQYVVGILAKLGIDEADVTKFQTGTCVVTTRGHDLFLGPASPHLTVVSCRCR